MYPFVLSVFVSSFLYFVVYISWQWLSLAEVALVNYIPGNSTRSIHSRQYDAKHASVSTNCILFHLADEFYAFTAIISLPFPMAFILFFVSFVVVPSCLFSSVICFCLYLARVLSIITYAQHFIMKIKRLVQHFECVCSLLIKMNNSNKAMSYCVSVFLDSIQQILSKLRWALDKMENFLIKKCATMVFQLNQVERFWFWIELKCVCFFSLFIRSIFPQFFRWIIVAIWIVSHNNTNVLKLNRKLQTGGTEKHILGV